MAAWRESELRRNATPTWIWSVVAFQQVDGPINDRIDDAYRRKYRGSSYLAPMIRARARGDDSGHPSRDRRPIGSHETRGGVTTDDFMIHRR
jgi:hypothetical protein